MPKQRYSIRLSQPKNTKYVKKLQHISQSEYLLLSMVYLELRKKDKYFSTNTKNYDRITS